MEGIVYLLYMELVQPLDDATSCKALQHSGQCTHGSMLGMLLPPIASYTGAYIFTVSALLHSPGCYVSLRVKWFQVQVPRHYLGQPPDVPR